MPMPTDRHLLGAIRGHTAEPGKSNIFRPGSPPQRRTASVRSPRSGRLGQVASVRSPRSGPLGQGAARRVTVTDLLGVRAGAPAEYLGGHVGHSPARIARLLAEYVERGRGGQPVGAPQVTD